MQSGNEAIADDVEALKAALAAERAISVAALSRAEAAEVDAAAARANRSDDQALIAPLKLQIETLRHLIYGPRSERTSRLIDLL